MLYCFPFSSKYDISISLENAVATELAICEAEIPRRFALLLTILISICGLPASRFVSISTKPSFLARKSVKFLAAVFKSSNESDFKTI